MKTDLNLEWLYMPEIVQVNRIKPHSDHYYETEQGQLVQSLNGIWNFTYAKHKEERNFDLLLEDCDISKMKKIKVPSHIELEGYDKCQYNNVMYPWDGVVDNKPPFIDDNFNPMGTYIKEFILNEKLKNKKQFISFQGVERAFYVLLNGIFIGYSEDSNTPSEFEITDALKEGTNRIVVVVFKHSSASWLEDQDMWRFSGIFRDVYIYAVEQMHLRDIFVKTDLKNEYKDGVLSLELEYLTQNSENFIKGYSLIGSLVDKNNKEVASFRKPIISQEDSLSINVDDVFLWSAEEPNLYTLILIIEDNANDMIETIYQKVGFRKIELINKVYCINGKRIVFRGVNRHEFSHVNGRALTKEEMLYDINFMKKNNINAVRTSHYPNQSYWYDLCDEYGIYLIDETNLETHGTWQCRDGYDPQTAVPSDNPIWLNSLMDRAESMLERDKNHPSIVSWSCGNEAFGGLDIYKMSEYFRKKDPSRFVHYEGVANDRRYNETSDVESRMYLKPDGIEEYLKNDPKKPFMSCEYMHAMGNSLGGMKHYTDLEDKYEMFQGGFIWDYIDQAIEKKREDGSKFLAYGGDFKEKPNDNNFCCDGVIFADRTYSPKVQEMKYLYQSIILKPSLTGIEIINKNNFISTKDYDFKIVVYKDDKIIKEDTVNIVVNPLETLFYEYKIESIEKECDYLIIASAHLKKDKLWAKAGYEVAFGEFLKKKTIVNDKSDKNIDKSFSLVEGDVNVGIKGEGFSVMFSRQAGSLISLIYDDVEYIERRPMPSYYRAQTDNDKGCKFAFESGIWKFIEENQIMTDFDYEVTIPNKEAIIKINYKIPADKEVIISTSYKVNALGEIYVNLSYSGSKTLPNIPLFGMNFTLIKELERFEYFGKGEMENYIDRNNGYKTGIYEGFVKNNLTPYSVVQACGNRTKVRWVKLKTNKDSGLLFEAINQEFEFTALPNSEGEMDAAYHAYELPDYNYTFFNILAKQMGVGGDDSWGAPVRDEYLISAKNPISLDFVVKKCNK